MEYVDQRNGGYYVAGTRISLDSVVYAFLRGETPEEIEDSYPGCMTPEQIVGAIEFYTRNRSMVDEYLRQGELEFDRMREESRAQDPEFYAKMEAAQQERLLSRS
jgi:uncharacterized protein (DUF433 family)